MTASTAISALQERDRVGLSAGPTRRGGSPLSRCQDGCRGDFPAASQRRPVIQIAKCGSDGRNQGPFVVGRPVGPEPFGKLKTGLPEGRPAGRATRHDELFDLFQGRTASRLAPATVKKYAWTLEQCLRLVEEQAGRPLRVGKLLSDGAMLGYVCSISKRPQGGPPISAWTAAHRRTVLRAAAGTLAPELRALGLNEPIQHVNRAIQQVAEKVGGGYRLSVGKPRHRGRPAPSASELDALLADLGADEGWAGQRNALFFGILAATGMRVQALLEVDGRDICLMGMTLSAFFSTTRRRAAGSS